MAIVGINSNDVANYPADSPAQNGGGSRAPPATCFPYLYDETQAVAKAYRAACTPDFYLFDKTIAWSIAASSMTAARATAIPVTGKDMRAALEAVLAGKPVPRTKRPSIGCNIKWKPGNEPEYF